MQITLLSFSITDRWLS